MMSQVISPVDAATMIIIDHDGSIPRVLLGRRHEQHVFMPGKFVFPGGRVEHADAVMPFASPLSPAVEARLLQETNGIKTAHAFPLAAIRETFEETGLLLGKRAAATPNVPAGAWTGFAQTGFMPDLSDIQFITRAITPPGFPRRFDARFFAADASAIAHQIENIIHADAELVELVWVSITEAHALDLPMITHLVLDELQNRIAAGFDHDLPVPFYQMQGTHFTRGLI